MKLTKQQKMLAAVIGALVALCLLQRLIIAPFMKRLGDINGRTKAGVKRLEKMIYIDSHKETIAAEYANVKLYIEPGETDEDALAVIMKKIEHQASRF